MRVWGCTDVVVVEMKSFFKNMCVMLLSMISLKLVIMYDYYAILDDTKFTVFRLFFKKKIITTYSGSKSWRFIM